MLHSATTILEQYIDDAHWFKFHFFEQLHIDVVERAYVCLVNSRWFIIYETDYLLADLPEVTRLITDTIETKHLVPVHWLVKKNSVTTSKTLPLGTEIEDDTSLQESIIYKDPETSMRYALLEAIEA